MAISKIKMKIAINEIYRLFMTEYCPFIPY